MILALHHAAAQSNNWPQAELRATAKNDLCPIRPASGTKKTTSSKKTPTQKNLVASVKRLSSRRIVWVTTSDGQSINKLSAAFQLLLIPTGAATVPDLANPKSLQVILLYNIRAR